MRKGSERWNEGVKMKVEEKKRVFEEWLQSNSVKKCERYREKNMEVKRKKHLARGKEVYATFMDLAKVYDRVDKEAMQSVMRLYGICGRLLQAVKILYIGNKVCIRIGNEVSEWFPMRSKFTRCTRRGGSAKLNVRLSGELLEEVDQFKYLCPVVAANGGVEAVVHQSVNEACKLLVAEKGVVKNRGLGVNVKRVLFEKVIAPTLTYGSELWGMKVTERQRLNVFVMKYLKSMADISLLDRVKNEVVRVRTVVRNVLAARVDINVLR
ncbi:uncharacterized protein [Palaemon carinicauda]|uniref:uncharacterized protein n=1 Tax=Palaemon carinicauda TaxID=392227 RepID=UPI0035B5BC92